MLFCSKRYCLYIYSVRSARASLQDRCNESAEQSMKKSEGDSIRMAEGQTQIAAHVSLRRGNIVRAITAKSRNT